MSRIGAIVRRLYTEELKLTPNKGAGTTEVKRRGTKGKLQAFKKTLSKRRTIQWILRFVVVLVVIFVIVESVFQYNRLVSWRTVVEARRADVERELRRRENLIPNLVYVVSKYAVYEQGVLKDVADVRESPKTTRSSQAMETGAVGGWQGTLSRLVARAEEYPDLKATQPIQDLIKEATNTEDRVAEAKKEYNKACEIYNQYRTVVPGNVYAFIYRLKFIPFIGLEEDGKVLVINLNMAEQDADIEENVEFPVINGNTTQQNEDMKKNPAVPHEVSGQTDNNTIEK